MTKDLWGKTACKCAKCAHIWLDDLPDLPKNCANRQCRTTKWNKDEREILKCNIHDLPIENGGYCRLCRKAIDEEVPPLPVPARAPAMTPAEKPYETFQKSLCTHGLYKPLCRRCQAAA